MWLDEIIRAVFMPESFKTNFAKEIPFSAAMVIHQFDEFNPNRAQRHFFFNYTRIIIIIQNKSAECILLSYNYKYLDALRP